MAALELAKPPLALIYQVISIDALYWRIRTPDDDIASGILRGKIAASISSAEIVSQGVV